MNHSIFIIFISFSIYVIVYDCVFLALSIIWNINIDMNINKIIFFLQIYDINLQSRLIFFLLELKNGIYIIRIYKICRHGFKPCPTENVGKSIQKTLKIFNIIILDRLRAEDIAPIYLDSTAAAR